MTQTDTLVSSHLVVFLFVETKLITTSINLTLTLQLIALEIVRAVSLFLAPGEVASLRFAADCCLVRVLTRV
jgi:hypothetical protein